MQAIDKIIINEKPTEEDKIDFSLIVGELYRNIHVGLREYRKIAIISACEEFRIRFEKMPPGVRYLIVANGTLGMTETIKSMLRGTGVDWHEQMERNTVLNNRFSQRDQMTCDMCAYLLVREDTWVDSACRCVCVWCRIRTYLLLGK